MKKGFTLIELLVVISIIGVLSSVVLASLNSARQKAKEAAIKSSVRQLERIMQLEYDETGTYATIQDQAWVPQSYSCDQIFNGVTNTTRQTQARALCKTIVANGPAGLWANPGYLFLVGNGLDNSQKFSIMAALNSQARFFCTGSGGTSDNAFYWANSSGQDISQNGSLWPTSPAGCYYNP